MNRIFRNTTAVIVLTLFTGLAVFSAVQLGGRLAGTSDASARTLSTQAATSEATGQQQGSDAYGYGQSSGAYDYGQSAGSGAPGDGTLTCPSTGCTASSCHATQ